MVTLRSNWSISHYRLLMHLIYNSITKDIGDITEDIKGNFWLDVEELPIVTNSKVSETFNITVN